jgi:type IV fimbrial biogenesis protein FimT
MRAARSACPQAAGFTLIELLVTLAVAAIVVSLAVPSFQSVVNGNKLAAAANEMVASLQVARMEAVRRNRRAAVCTSADANAGTGATCAGADVDGWITFLDENGDGDFDPPGDTLLRTSLLEDGVVIATSPAVGDEVVFRPDGMALVADTGTGTDLLDGVISFCIPTTRPVENQRLLEIASGSAIQVRTNDGGGACGAPGDPP